MQTEFNSKSSKLQKAEVLAELRRVEMNYDPNVSAVEAKQLLRQWQDQNICAEVVSMAKESGHVVLFTPPHYSDLQPIRLLWAKIKSSVAKKYSLVLLLMMFGIDY